MPIRRQPRIVSDQDLAELLSVFEQATEINAKGNIQFNRFDTDELERILPDAFEADPSFSPRQLRYLLRRALWDARKSGPLTADRLLAHATNGARHALAQPLGRYALWTKFRARQMAFTGGFRLNWNGVSLESANRLPHYMRRDEFFLNGHGSIDPQYPVFYGHLIARCSARDEETAAGTMLDAIEIFMAMFNMYETYGRGARGADRWAEAKLWNGPYQFLFRGREFLGDRAFWYEPDFNDEAWGMFPLDMAKVLELVPRVRRALASLADHPMRSVLTATLRLMQNAMESRDQSYSLLRYWSALEQLYGDPGARDKSYPRIIQRASFAEHDQRITRWKLGHISRLRNEYVHARNHGDELRIMAQFLRNLLSRHINFLLFHAPEVRSHSQWLEIVDLPNDEAALKGRKSAIDQRLTIIARGRDQRSGADR